MRLNEARTWTATHRSALVLVWLGWIFDFYDIVLYLFLLRPISMDLGLSDPQHSLAMGLSLGATGIGGAVFGVLADRYGRKRVLQWTILTYSAGVFLSGLAPEFWSLLAFRMLTGLGAGGEWGVGHVLLAEIMPAHSRGRAGALMQSGAPIGVGLAVLVQGFFVPQFGWRAAFLASAVSAFLVLLVRRHLCESDLWLERRKRGEASETYLSQVRELLAPQWRSRTAFAFVLTLLCMSAYWSTFTWMPEYLRTEWNLDAVNSVPWWMCIVGGELFGYVAFGFVSDRIGRKPSFTVFAVLSAIGLLMITVFSSAIADRPILLYGAMLVVGAGTGYWSNFGPFFSELFGTRLRATAVCTAYNLARGAQFYTPTLVWLVAGTYGLGGGIAIAAAFSLAAAIWIWTLPETKGVEITA